MKDHPERTKQVFQHIYTFDKSTFDKLKESFHIHNLSHTDSNPEEEAYYKFHLKVKDQINNIVTSTRPEFGYCTECEEFLNKKQRKKYPKLKDIDDIFWDSSKW